MSIDLDTLAARLAAMTPGPWRVGSVERWHIIVPYPESIAGPCGERVLLRANEHFPYGADLAGIADLRNAADELIRLARVGQIAVRYVELPGGDDRITDAYYEMCDEVRAYRAATEGQ